MSTIDNSCFIFNSRTDLERSRENWSRKELKGVISLLDLLFGMVTSKLKLCLSGKLRIWPVISKI
ncbi:unnamed protein product [Coffea canephora]|uniref:Uncharacterized protein n=1 Tax=Coffea canephora TaxID=49390 RepID=A0A068V3H7_COFCA|nr:unnamed protein product [Coffea canephora]